MNIDKFRKLLIEEVIKSTYILPGILCRRIEQAHDSSEGLEKKVLFRILENIKIAEEKKIPVCQDTGIFEIWLYIGNEADINGVNFNAIVSSAVQQAHKDGRLRQSMSEIEPVIHTQFVYGKFIEVIVTPRGFGSENYSYLHMLNPESSFEEIMDIILKDVRDSAGHPCPPYIIGIGIGGTASKAIEISTLALAEINFEPDTREARLLEEINKIGIGAGGMGGKYTALGVKINYFPQHIAGLALGVHIGCWCNRIRRFKFKV
jgi:fumarate hydratase subunit alpha